MIGVLRRLILDSLFVQAFVRIIMKTSLFKYTENFTTKNENFQIKKNDIFHISAQNIDCGYSSTVEPRYLELAYFELPLISKWKSGHCFNMKLWQQVTK